MSQLLARSSVTSGESARRDALPRAPAVVICPTCETAYRRIALERGVARCYRCDTVLYRGGRATTVAAMLATAVTALAGFVLALSMPLATLDSKNHRTAITLWDAATVAADRGLAVVAFVLAITLVVAPLVELFLLLWVLVPLAGGVRPPGFVGAMRMISQLRPWRMIEVFLLGLVVAMVKLGTIAKVTPGWGIAGVAFMTVALWTIGTIDRDTLWRRAEEVS